MNIRSLVSALSNPRLDVLIVYELKSDFETSEKIKQTFKSRNLMCEIVSKYKYDNVIFLKNYDHEIAHDLFKKSFIVLFVNCNYESTLFLDINKLVFNNNKLECNSKAKQYLNEYILDREYNIKNDLDFIVDNIITKLFIQNYKIVAAISHMNEKTLDLTIESIKKQTIPVEKIKVFKGLIPMCNSFNACLDFACEENADILLHTASDVVFEPWALKELLRIYDPKKHANVLSFGEDIILKRVNKTIYDRAVCGIWIFNMNLFKDKQWRFKDEMKQDMKLFDRIKMNTGLIVSDNLNHYLNNGLDNCICPMFDIKYEQQNQGIHHPIWTLREIFDKYYYCLGKWKDAFKQELLQITNEFLKHNPNNNCLITIKYILTNIKTNTLKSKDSNELENIYKKMISKIDINTDSNNNFFVYHKKYIEICNNLYNCKINCKSYDNIYNENNLFYSITNKQLKFSNIPFFCEYMKLPQHKRVINNKFINHNYLNYINFLLSHKYFFIQINKNNNSLIDNKKIRYFYNTINGLLKKKILNVTYISILIYLYDINYILYNDKQYFKYKRVKYISYILNNYTNDKFFDYNNMQLDNSYKKVLNGNLSSFDSNNKINKNYIIKTSLLIGEKYLNETNKMQNHYLLLSKNINEIKVERNSLQKRNIIFRIKNIRIYFDKHKLYTNENIAIEEFNSIHFLNTEKYYIFYFNLSTQIYMFLTNIQHNIQYLGDNNTKFLININ